MARFADQPSVLDVGLRRRIEVVELASRGLFAVRSDDIGRSTARASSAERRQSGHMVTFDTILDFVPAPGELLPQDRHIPRHGGDLLGHALDLDDERIVEFERFQA
jgi:hypothetical protein